MTEMLIKIEARELADAIEHLAQALSARSRPAETTAPAAEAQAAPAAPKLEEAAAQQTKTPEAPKTAVPTAAPEYTLDQIARAGVTLVDAGKRGELTSLLAEKFKVQAITQIPPAQYGALAAELRALGAII